MTEFNHLDIYYGNSGMATIQLTAFYPFARMSNKDVWNYNAYGNEYRDKLMSTTGVLLEGQMPPHLIDTTTPIAGTKTVLLYNCGEELADVKIGIAGDVGAGISIYNDATRQTCSIIGLTQSLSTVHNKWLELDSQSGKVFFNNGQEQSMSFMYHDRGFIQLKGSNPIWRDIEISYNGNEIQSNNQFTEEMEGQYIRIQDQWRKITSFISPASMLIDHTYSAPGSEVSDVVFMNYITITPQTTMALTKLDFLYEPTFK
ncbi:MAG: hypothetical protein GX763_05875 [Clostridiaceae bacterium]|nr:hypothetical protein [Clostridiaceae bacterium]